MPQKAHQLFTILEAPLAHIKTLYLPPHYLLRIEGGVPWLDEEGAKHDLEHVWRHSDLLCGFACGSHTGAIQRVRIKGHWFEVDAMTACLHAGGICRVTT
jgi:hypothetical protein